MRYSAVISTEGRDLCNILLEMIYRTRVIGFRWSYETSAGGIASNYDLH
jgi:hypothetical protein